jgi:hypothetical protein
VVTFDPEDVSPCPFSVVAEFAANNGFTSDVLVPPGNPVMAEFVWYDLWVLTSPVDFAFVFSKTMSVTTSPTRRAL